MGKWRREDYYAAYSPLSRHFHRRKQGKEDIRKSTAASRSGEFFQKDGSERLLSPAILS